MQHVEQLYESFVQFDTESMLFQFFHGRVTDNTGQHN